MGREGEGARGRCTAYRAAIIAGLVFALLLAAAGFAGYSVLIYYSIPFIIFALLVLAAPVLERQPSVTAFFCALLILVTLSGAGALVGHYGRRLYSLRKCMLCEPMIKLLQKYRGENGRYPSSLSEVQGFALVQRDSGLCIGLDRFSHYGFDLERLNSCDALMYLDTNNLVCVVPVTKMLPMSFTRLYVYTWGSEHPSWQYDRWIWSLQRKRD